MTSRVDSPSALRTSRPRDAPRATRRDVCERPFKPRASMRFARLPQATSSTQPAAMSSSFNPASILIAHGCDTCATGNEIRSADAGLLFAGLHVGHMAREPVMELDAQLGFERLGIHAGADAADDVQPVRIGAFEALGFAIEQRIERHFHNIYAKLGVSGRSARTAAVSQLLAAR